MVALFGATALGKTEVALRARGGWAPRSSSPTRCRSTPGWRIVTNQPDEAQERARRSTSSASPAAAGVHGSPSTRGARTRSSTAARGGDGAWSSKAVPGCTCGRRSVTWTSPGRREGDRPCASAGGALGARSGRSRRGAGGARTRHVRAPRHAERAQGDPRSRGGRRSWAGRSRSRNATGSGGRPSAIPTASWRSSRTRTARRSRPPSTAASTPCSRRARSTRSRRPAPPARSRGRLLQAIGVAELCAVLDGEMSLGDAARRMKTRTRALVRRQLTWMRKLPDAALVPAAGRDADGWPRPSSGCCA